MSRRYKVGDHEHETADDDLPPFSQVVVDRLAPKFAKVGGRVALASAMEYLHEPRVYVKTGIYALDAVISGGRGVPCGRFIEIFAPEGVGKSALCEYLVGRFKAIGGTVHYIDTEQTISYQHLACYGVEKQDLVLPDLPDLEAVWDYVVGVTQVLRERNEIRQQRKLPPEPPNLIVLDSLAATPSRDELRESEHDDSHVGLQARANAKGVRKTLRAFSASDAVFLCVNQVRDKIGAFGFGPKTDTPGGRALKFAYSVRLKLAKTETVKEGGAAIGHLIEATAVKNKHAPIGRTAVIALSYTRGIDADWSNFIWFQQRRYITAKGRHGFVFRGCATAFARHEFGAFCHEHAGLIEEAVQECLREAVSENRTADGDA